MAKQKRKIKSRKTSDQALGALALNGQLSGFVTGNIYTAANKSVCQCLIATLVPEHLLPALLAHCRLLPIIPASALVTILWA